MTIQHEEIYQKVLAKKDLKDIEKVKEIQIKQTFTKWKKKFYLQVGGNDKKTYQQLNASNIWQLRKRNKKTEWISNIEKDLEGLEEGPKAKVYIDSLRTTLKNTK